VSGSFREGRYASNVGYMRSDMKKLLAVATLGVALILGQGTAYAIPILQLYIEGATYDNATETWVLTPAGSSGGEPFLLWAMGNVDGPGAVSNVRLSVAYSKEDVGFAISFTPVTTGGYGGFADPSVPGAPTYLQTVADGSSPVLGDGKSLPTHGIFGPGTVWQEYLLGDFTLEDSPVGDFTGSFPTPSNNPLGQINVYEVSVTGGHGATLHFDLYDTITSPSHAVFAPFSHDADAETNIVPEPASFIVWFVIGLSWAGSAWRHQYRRRWQKWQQEEAVAGKGVSGPDLEGRFAADPDEVRQRLGAGPAARSAARGPAHRQGG
jgi:hypothetical protein